jgi:dimethylhistidine N-methyltransferase
MTAPSFLHRARLDRSGLRNEVLSGLRGSPKTLPPKFFYDARGAALFEEICTLPEYYLTRSELSILEAHAAEMAALAGPDCAMIEYGSGAGTKARLILDALENPRAYVPVDISRAQLNEVSAELSQAYPQIAVHPVWADYTSRFQLPSLPDETRGKLAFFPGSTIGNFHPQEAAAFLSRVRHVLGHDGSMILGVDRVKDVDELNAAYNDSRGVTAEFNLNMLDRLNHDVGADFDTSSFEHVAFFNSNASRIEMHLRSRIDQTVCVAAEAIHFSAGETIWTESSYKYDRTGLDGLVGAGGFRIVNLWSEPADKFWVAYLSVV